MTWKLNYSITQLFLCNRKIFISNENGNAITVNIPSVGEQLNDMDLAIFYSLTNRINLDSLKKGMSIENDLDVIKKSLTDPNYTNVKEFKLLSRVFTHVLSTVLVDFKINNRELFIKDIPLNDELWKLIIFVLRDSAGYIEDTEIKTFRNEAAKRLYQQQQEAEAKIAKMKSKNVQDDGLMKQLLLITYAFPSWTLEKLVDLSMIQIRWLQQFAINSCIYKTESMAYANGNLKKAPKFFLG